MACGTVLLLLLLFVVAFDQRPHPFEGATAFQQLAAGVGRIRHRGRRPQVRGSVMNPVDHPHGGGEGKTSVGMPGPKTPWGKPALGFRTRHNKSTDKFIVRRRGKGRR